MTMNIAELDAALSERIAALTAVVESEEPHLTTHANIASVQDFGKALFKGVKQPCVTLSPNGNIVALWRNEDSKLVVDFLGNGKMSALYRDKTDIKYLKPNGIDLKQLVQEYNLEGLCCGCGGSCKHSTKQ